MSQTDWEPAILALVRRPAYRPVKPRRIAEQLRASKSELAEVKRAIKRLVARGQLIYGSNHLVEAADPSRPKTDRLVGVFRRAEKGFGLVRPSGAALGQTAGQDIYIPAHKAGDASTGDVVAVRLRGRRGRGQRALQGEIVEVLQRQTYQFVGTYFDSRGSGFVQIDGALFSRPIFVGDASARNARPGDKVVIDMIRFPSQFDPGEGVIVEVLGPQSKPGVDTLCILREFHLPERFPQEVLDEARAEAAAFQQTVPEERLDATGQWAITIDPVDARDFDDAVSLVRLDNGHWRLGVHIADVSHFVRPRSAMDREAFQRGTSVYLPDRVIPMLPELISNGLASLQPGKIRYTKTVYLEFTPEGRRVASGFHSSAIKSRKRLTYEQVDEFLSNPESFRGKWPGPLCALLLQMRELAAILRQRRIARGALELAMPEVKIELDRQGRVCGARMVPYTESHQIIEEFMLAANEAVAEMLRDKGVPFLRRIHPSPNPAKLRALEAFVRDLGLTGRGLESRVALQKLLTGVIGRPQQNAVHYAVLRALPRAVYSPKEEGHYALASPCYCHFTSPIRRYPDLTVHRLLDAALAGRKPKCDVDELVLWGEHCSEREQRAESAERELTKLKLLGYLSQRIGEQMDAVITGVESFGLFVQGVQLPAEGLIHVDSLVDDYYRFDRTAHSLFGRRSGNQFRLGDVVRVAVARVDLERRELDFRLVARQGPAARKASRESAAREHPPTRRLASPDRSRGKSCRRQ
ncbi:MAG: ribonuclease R [Thermoguttaceae bacterium]